MRILLVIQRGTLLMSSDDADSLIDYSSTDDDLRIRFFASPADVARESGLSDEERRAIEEVDRDGLILARECYARKRRNKSDFNRGETQLWSGLRRTSRLLLLLVKASGRLCYGVPGLAARAPKGSK